MGPVGPCIIMIRIDLGLSCRLRALLFHIHTFVVYYCNQNVLFLHSVTLQCVIKIHFS